ncbi:hypothetical protein Pla123a_28220 [Posidoniimonas polymericola]|uniref:Uncharacterized protein n=1 Tax=Posidoniimonas polymericola TaxID=2528002 RepID=A0A5C5YMF7_9BACT|nr:hypothetical protein [Posidoniimonas polymericola]TWT76036.1 hypothetical protein Pla123a_28220 [Posidoniimonas polymericola]
MLSRLLQKLPPLLILIAAAHAAAGEPASLAKVEVGFAGRYKLGSWTPVVVTVAGEAGDLRLEITAPDGDGAPATVSTLGPPDASGRIHSLTRVGRRDAVIRCRLFDGDRLADQWRSGRDLDAPVRGLPVAEPLIVEAGRDTPLAELPTNPLAYEGVDALVVSGVSPEEIARLTNQQATAIEQWVASGGKILLGGGEHAADLVGADGPLRTLAPGEHRETVRVSNTGVIEDYAGSEEPIDAPFGGLTAARLDNVRGVVELHAGGRAVEMPLVVRTVHGFGSVTYAAFDLYDPAFTNWPSRERLWSLLLQTRNADDSDGGSGALVTSAYSDLSGALQTKLGQQFAGVQSTSILMLVAAAGVYLALLGPGAYYLGKNVTGRMTTAWVAYPLIALAVAGAALWWGEQSTGDTARLNKLEVIDIDAASGRERATVWGQLLSPQANLYDLSCEPRDSAQPTIGYLSWCGLPGRGLGGMQTSAESLLAGEVSYHTDAALDGMTGVPINRRASKSLAARWLMDGRPSVAFELAATGTGLVEGVLTNDSQLELKDVKLIAGNWAWRLPDLAPGDIASIDASGSPARLRTLLLNDFGDANQTDRRLSANRLTAPSIAYLLMFYDALGGLDTSPLPDFRQSRVDLSHALAAGRPILVARSEQPRCDLRQDVLDLDAPSDAGGTYYRFIGPPITEPQP